MIPDEAIRFRVIAKKDMQNRDRMIFISNKNIK